MAMCPKCGVSGIGLETFGHGSPCTDRAKLVQEAEEWLEEMKAHTNCCGTPMVRRLVAALKAKEPI